MAVRTTWNTTSILPQAQIQQELIRLQKQQQQALEKVIPAEMHAAIEQGAIVLKAAKNKDAAHAFLEFVKSTEGRAILAEYGFGFPERVKKEEKR